MFALASFFLGREFEKHSLKFHVASGYIIPDAAAVKILSCGFNNLASDFFAIQAVHSLYVVDKLDTEYWKDSVKAFKEFLKGKDFHSERVKLDVISFSRYAYISSYLDPFDVERIELFTLLMDWMLNFPEGSIPILEYAARKNTSDWKLPYYLALNYLIHKNDRQRALLWLKTASLRPQAADIVKSFLIEIASEGASRENILSGLMGLRGIVKDEEIKKSIDENIRFFEKGGTIRKVDWETVRKKLEKLRIEESEEHHEEAGKLK